MGNGSRNATWHQASVSPALVVDSHSYLPVRVAVPNDSTSGKGREKEAVVGE
jgi:hypothetical protein